MSDVRLLPIRTKPQPDELCSSWLLRLAAESGMTLQAFHRLISPRIRIPVYDCDLALGIHQLRPIAEATGADVEVVRSTLLRFDNGSEKGSAWPEPWLLPVGSGDYTKERIGYQYCPVCLATGVAYFRKRWRLSLFTVCTQHECQLVDSCGRCELPIHGFAIGLAGLERVLARNGEAPFLRCTSCGWDLRSAAAEVVQVDSNILNVQHRHEEWLARYSQDDFNPSDYFWMLNHAVEVFAKDMGTLPFSYLKSRYRAQVLQRAEWLLEGDRWRYIQSICRTPRLSLHLKKLPATAQLGEKSLDKSAG